jgi:hypothetical protein
LSIKKLIVFAISLGEPNLFDGIFSIIEFKKAADYYEMEKSNSKNSHQNCLLKVADLMCLSDHKDTFEECKQVLLFNYLFSTGL